MIKHILVGLVAFALLPKPANALDLVWADNLRGQILRGTVGSQGDAQVLFGIGDYPGSPSAIAPLGIATDQDFVYWSDIATGQILRGSVDGSGTAQVLFGASDYPAPPLSIGPAGLAVAGGYIYWTDTATGQILRGSADGTGPAVSLYGVEDYPGAPVDNYPWGIAIAAGTIYWSDSDTSDILRAPADGSGAVEVVFASDNERVNQGLALDGGSVYWGDVETDQLQGRILRGSLNGGGQPQVLYGPADYPGPAEAAVPVSVAASNGVLYWTDTLNRQILSGAQDGSGDVSVVFDITSYPGAPTDIRPAFIAAMTSNDIADFDGDGDVDGRDFMVWQRGQSPSTLSAADLTLWKEQYGTGVLAAVQAVPEPVTAALLMFAVAAVVSAKWRG